MSVNKDTIFRMLSEFDSQIDYCHDTSMKAYTEMKKIRDEAYTEMKNIRNKKQEIINLLKELDAKE